MDGELAEVRGYPLALQFFGDSGSGAGAAEKIGDEIAFTRRSFDNAFKKGLRFLGWVANPLWTIAHAARFPQRIFQDLFSYLVNDISMFISNHVSFLGHGIELSLRLFRLFIFSFLKKVVENEIIALGVDVQSVRNLMKISLTAPSVQY